MPRDERKVRLAEGQTDMGWGEADDLTPDPAIIYGCRSCLSTRVVGPIKRTVDERWVHATCLDCGERVIANVYRKSTPSQEQETETP